MQTSPSNKNPDTVQPNKKKSSSRITRNKSEQAIKIFFCYAHEDEQLLNKLKMQLVPFKRQGLISLWYDRDISAGTEWENEISTHLNSAQIILLLISPDFINSDYCYGIEMKRALKRHESKQACVIPIILRPVHWESVIGHIQALPKDGNPVISSSWHNLDEAFYDVAEGIRKVLSEFLTHSVASGTSAPNIAHTDVSSTHPVDIIPIAVTPPQPEDKLSSLYDEEVRYEVLKMKKTVIGLSSAVEDASFEQTLHKREIITLRDILINLLHELQTIETEKASFFINSKLQMEEKIRDIIDEFNITLEINDSMDSLPLSMFQERTDSKREFNRTIKNIKKSLDELVLDILI